jgi:hypothetical protein
MAEPGISSPPKNLRALRILDSGVLLTLGGLVLYTVSKHEPWADEAQAWLVARDFGWLRMIFSELRYEGHPPLWFVILWPAIHLFHMPYAYLGYLGGTIAILGLAFLIFLAPFPRPLRYLIASSFFFVYQYAVIARPYVLMPLLGFGAAYFYRKGLSRILTCAICVALLLQVSSYAAVIAIAFAAVYTLQLTSGWSQIPKQDRNRAVAAGALVALSLVMLVVVLLPRSDSSLVAEATRKTFEQHLQLVLEGLVGAFADSALLAVPLIIAAIWAHERRGLLLMSLGVGGAAFVYGFLRGYGHHQGLITIAFVVCLWAAWPSSEQLDSLPRDSLRIHQAFLVALLVLFGWHCTWSYTAIRNDWAGPYSGARDAAMFLKSVHADKVGCRGYSFWAVGVQPYFDHNIFVNKGSPDVPASAHFAFAAAKLTDTIYPSEIQNGAPFILISLEEAPQKTDPIVNMFWGWNYRLVHSSDGTRFFKNKAGVHALYLIFARTDWILAQRDMGWNPEGDQGQQSSLILP